MTFLYRFSRNSYLLKGITWKFFVPNFIQFCWEIQKLRYKFVQVHKVKYDSHCSDFDENHTSSTVVHKVQFHSGYCRLRRHISNSCLIGWLFVGRGYITRRKLSVQKHSSLTLQATEISKSYTGRCIWDCYFSQTTCHKTGTSFVPCAPSPFSFVFPHFLTPHISRYGNCTIQLCHIRLSQRCVWRHRCSELLRGVHW